MAGRVLRLRTFIVNNPYGYYDASAREYVITRPDTPTPWLNYLGQGGYGGIVSNTGGGYSFDRDPRNRRVTRYRYNSIPADQPGRYVYLRDAETGAYWSATWQPVTQVTLDAYECRHGAGYTRLRTEYGGIASDMLYFVPPDRGEGAACELWVLNVRNSSDRPRRISTCSYAEWSYWDAITDQQNLDWAQQIMRSTAHDSYVSSGVIFRPTRSFLGCSRPFAGYETDREAFIGRCRSLANPLMVETGCPANGLAPRGNNIAALWHDLALGPGEEVELVYVLGVTDDPGSIEGVVRRYSDPSEVATARSALAVDWDRYLDAFTVALPDAEMEAMVNVWNPIQCRANLFWSRFASGYDTGLGRGMGTRDSAQDTLGTVHNAPARAKDTLRMLWKLQFVDGHAWHQVFPLTGEGGPGLAGEFPQWPQWFSDDHLWLVIATCHYLKETGDFAFLDEALPFQDGEPLSVWDHLRRAIAFTLANRGPHGLPRLGFADWDDTMNLDHGSGWAESVWTGQQFCRATLDLRELAAYLGRETDATELRGFCETMRDAVEASGWDGAPAEPGRYLRAYDDAGEPVGTSSATHHALALNTQTWAVIGELDRDRAAQAMDAAHAGLNCEYGLRLMAPAYDGADERVRGTTTYPPGAKENGGIFCHANAWAIVAAAQLGQAERAYQYYRQILPLARSDSDSLMTEPYVYCQNICAPEHPHAGRGRNSWLTGTAAWTYVAATQYILGIRPAYEGLRIRPVIPASWQGFTAKRTFRGTAYQIEVVRRGRGDEVSLTVNGQPIEGDVVPFTDEAVVRVRVELR
jgi:cellobiose phosphorylase